MQAAVNPDARFPNLETIVAREELTDAARGDWATPTAQDAKQNGMRTKSRHVMLVSQAIREDWATPTARDWRSCSASQEAMERNSRPLSGQVGAMFPTPKASDGRSKGTGGGTDRGLDAMARAGQLDAESNNTPGRPRGLLNPDWVEQLMGAPAGWTALSEEDAYTLSATRIRRKSPKRSGER